MKLNKAALLNVNSFNHIFFGNPIAIIIFLPSGCIELCNQSASELFAGPSKNIDCHHIDQLFQNPLLPHIQNVLSGSERTISLQAIGLKDESNPFVCQIFISTFIDEEGVKKCSASIIPQTKHNSIDQVPTEADVIFEQTDSSFTLIDTNFYVTKN